MKSITRYASILSACSILSAGALLADNTTASTASANDNTTQGGTAVPRSDNTTGTSGSSNSTTQNGTSSDNASMSNNAMAPATSNSMSSSSGMIANDPLATSLQSADYANRSQLATEIDQRIDAQKDTLKSLKKDGKHLDGQAKSDFKAAWDDVEAREKDLKHSVHQARSASQDRWDASRSQLASNYQAFEAAVSRLQTQVGTGANSMSTSNTMSK